MVETALRLKAAPHKARLTFFAANVPEYPVQASCGIVRDLSSQGLYTPFGKFSCRAASKALIGFVSLVVS